MYKESLSREPLVGNYMFPFTPVRKTGRKDDGVERVGNQASTDESRATSQFPVAVVVTEDELTIEEEKESSYHSSDVRGLLDSIIL